jgi:16S rRNA processing protein RimM
MATPERLCVGAIVGVFGVQGELKLRSYTDPIHGIARYRPWQLRQRGEAHEFSDPRVRPHGKGLLLRLPGVDDRDAAERWAGQYYWADLEGMAVSTVDGVELGTVSHLFSTGANDVMAVAGERERLIPYINDQVIRSVDPDARRIVVDWDPDF